MKELNDINGGSLTASEEKEKIYREVAADSANIAVHPKNDEKIEDNLEKQLQNIVGSDAISEYKLNERAVQPIKSVKIDPAKGIDLSKSNSEKLHSGGGGNVPPTGVSSGDRSDYNGSYNHRNDNKKKKRIILGVVIGVLLGLLVIYSAIAFSYKNKFIKGTSINGMDVSGLTLDEVEEKIKTVVENYSITISFRDGASETISGDQIGYQYASTGAVQELLDKQNTFAWIKYKFGKTSEYDATTAATYDEELLRSTIEAFPEFDPANVTPPSDARCEWSDGSFQIIAEVEGNQIDEEKFISDIDNALRTGQTTFDAESAGDYLAPSVRSDDEHLNEVAASGNAVCNFSVTYQVPAGEETISGATVKDWLSQDENGFYYIDDDTLMTKCSEYVANLASTYDTTDTLTFHSTNWGDVSVDSCSFAWTIDQTTEAQNLYNDIKNHTVETREPAWSQEGSTLSNGGYGTTYIEVDITNQHVYCYVDGELFYDTDCVTGLNNESRRTVTGAFYIYLKQTDRTLLGPQIDGEPSYASHVNYWMPFYKGYGLHDASWRSSFGGSIYKYSGSHGCVNLPYNAAKTIYNTYSVGTPVIVFKVD